MTELRLPPQNLKAEQSVLACQMLDSRMVEVVREVVTAGDYYADVNALVQKAIWKLRDGGSELDVLTIAAQLESTGDLEEIGGPPYLMELLEAVPHAEHALYYAKIVATQSRRRRAIEIGRKLMESAWDPTKDEAEFSGAAIKAATKLADSGVAKTNLTSMSTVVAELISDLEKGVQASAYVGIPEVDQLTRGMAPGEMVVIGARPSHGKTLMALQILDCASANQWPGLVVSEEMAAKLLASRALAHLSCIQSEEWMKNTDRLRFDAKEHFGVRAPVFIAEKVGTATAAERAIETAVRLYGVKIVAVDYAQLLEGDGDNEQERIGDVSRRMKAMAMKHDLVMLLLAQLNRGIEARADAEPMLADLRGSGGLEQDADIALFPFWPWKIDSSYEDKLEYRVYQRKNRNRGMAEPCVKLRINPERQKLVGEPTPGEDWHD